MENKNPHSTSLIDRPKSLHERLKAATAQIHRELESSKSAGNLLSENLTQAEYLNYLERLFGFVQPLEELLKNDAHIVKFVHESDARWKTAALAADIQALGGTTDGPKAGSKDLPDVSSGAAAMGAMYVMEGSTLGGQLIRKQLLTHDFIREEFITYISAYREKTGLMWRAFLQSLADFEASGEATDAALPAAEATFRCLGGWLVETGPSKLR